MIMVELLAATLAFMVTLTLGFLFAAWSADTLGRYMDRRDKRDKENY